MRFLENISKSISTRTFSTSAAEKTDVISAKTFGRKGCLPDSPSGGAACSSTKKGVFRSMVERSGALLRKRVFDKNDFSGALFRKTIF